MYKYVTYYDYTHQSPNFLWIVGLFFIAIGIALTKFNYTTNRNLIKSQVAFGILFTALATVWTLALLSNQLRARFQNYRMIEAQSFKVVEGEVENYIPLPKNGRGMESFRVNGIFFEYHDAILTEGLHHHGAIKGNGEKVRIGYYTKKDNNIIIKVEKLVPTTLD